MEHAFILYISLILIILFLVMLAEKLRVAYPIVLVIGGLLLSIYSGIPPISIDPEMIFFIFLPPLLYEAAWFTSWKDMWRMRRVIGSFAFIIVILTSLVVAVVSSSLIPGFTLALGFLLGGIVSPPDAVSASTVLKYVKVPKTLSTIIEGESLLNDAASLIVFRFALIAVSTGQFIFREAAFSFVVVIVMGIITGVLIGMAYYAVHRWLPTTPNMDIVLTLTAPYVMYIAAESFHFSGVLSVVSGGLFLSVRSHIILSHRSRLQGINVWSTLGFVLNGIVFMLIGLALPEIVQQLGAVSLKSAIGYGFIITGVLIVTRLLSTLGASVFTTFMSRFITTAESHPGWRGPVIFGWAGMRGVVSLAAALSIPVHLSDGSPFPERNLILFITFMVILLTLVVQGLTLPLVIKWVNIKDNGHSPAENELMIKKQLTSHLLKFLEEKHSETLKTNTTLQQFKAKIENEHLHSGHDADVEHKDFLGIYLQLIAEQRQVLRDLNKQPDIDGELIRKQQGLLDLEEERLRIRFGEE